MQWDRSQSGAEEGDGEGGGGAGEPTACLNSVLSVGLI